jgi:mono/diheme cytochrome c family protein
VAAAGQAAGQDERRILDPPAAIVVPHHEDIGSERYPLAQALADGKKLFRAKFNLADGAGRPEATGDSKPTPRVSAGAAFQRVAGPDANSCAGCHNEPRVGGSGDFAANVFVGAHLSDPFTLTTAANVTNERNTVTLFGSGVVETIAREMTRELQAQRDRAIREAGQVGRQVKAELRAKGTDFGSVTASPDGYVDYDALDGVDFDLVVRPFGVKGVAASLREFTTFALNQHHGIQAVERFGWERTGRHDFDGDGKEVEFTFGQVTAMVLFQAALPIPNRADPSSHTHAGRRLFESTGCAACHAPRTEILSPVFTEPGPFNRPGAMSARDTSHVVRVPLDVPREGGSSYVEMYSDLKRHVMCDEEVRHFCNEQRRQDNVRLELFMTPRLWDLATSAPYCHRGDCTTLTEAILAHGGEGRPAREAFLAMPLEQQRELVDFLLSLGSGQTPSE